MQAQLGGILLGFLVLTAMRQLSCMTVCTFTNYYYRHSQVTMYKNVHADRPDQSCVSAPPPRPSHVLIVSK